MLKIFLIKVLQILLGYDIIIIGHCFSREVTVANRAT